MEENNKHINSLDDFSRSIKNKLENHPLPVQEGAWEEMEKRLQQNSSGKKKGSILTVLFVAAAIALLLVMIDFSGLLENNSYPMEESFTEIMEDNTHKEIPFSIKEEIGESLNPISSDVIPAIEKEYVQNDESFLDSNLYVSENVEGEDKLETNEVPPNVKEEKEESIIVEKIPAKKGGLLYVENENTPKRKNTKNKSWLLAGGMNTGGSVGLLNGEMDYQSLPESNNDASSGGGFFDPNKEFNNSNTLNSKEYSEIDYMIPLSFGITARKNINKYMGIETGLVYTYLATQYKGRSITGQKAKEKLHYLGIPVNLIVNAWENRDWNIYLSGGLMIEKGLRSIVTISQTNPIHKPEDIVIKSNINGIQWSLHASAGISYKMVKDWSLYIEPRISYYFDNDQPLSVRTDKPVVIGIGAGIRYAF